jgi:uncharacterized protein (DUF983 family)
MAKIICPQCDSEAAVVSLFSGRKPYCGVCGWNHQVVRSALSSERKVAFAVAGLGIALIAFVYLWTNLWWATVVVGAAFIILPLVEALSFTRQLSRLGPRREELSARQDGERAPKILRNLSTASATMGTKEYAELLALTRPRKVRLTWKGWINSLLLAAIVVLCSHWLPDEWDNFQHHRFRDGEAPVAVMVQLMVYGYALYFLWKRLRERKLLAYGDVAPGNVTRQCNYGRYSESRRIEYTFQDATGRSIAGRSHDPSRSLYEGMTTPIFYDPENPKRSIPLRCSLSKIRM